MKMENKGIPNHAPIGFNARLQMNLDKPCHNMPCQIKRLTENTYVV